MSAPGFDRAWTDALAAHIDGALAKRARKGLPSCADNVPDILKLAALMEEAGEVARAIQENESLERRRDELFDVATTAVLWASTLGLPPTRRGEGP